MDADRFPGEFPEWRGQLVLSSPRLSSGLAALGRRCSRAWHELYPLVRAERVGPNTQIEREHPQWLLHGEDPKRLLLDLGREEARHHVTETISAILTAAGVDVYRQDFNIDPLPFWQANDAPDCQGMGEIRHIEGLYLFWDELLARDLVDSTVLRVVAAFDLETGTFLSPLAQ